MLMRGLTNIVHKKIVMNKKYFLMVISCSIIVFTLTGCNNETLSTTPSTMYDDYIPDEAIFIDSSESEKFTYEAIIIVNGFEDKDDYQSLQYQIKITSKTDDIYENFRATGFIPDEMKNIMEINTYMVFGSAGENGTIINRHNGQQGLIIARTTWIPKNIDLDKLKSALKKTLRVKTIWDNGSEYVNIKNDDLKIQIKIDMDI